MSVISLRLPEKLLHQLDNGAQILHIQRAEYIHRAIESMNEDVVNQERKKDLFKRACW